MKKYLKHILSACLLLITFSMFSGEITPITGILKTVTGDTVMVGDSVEISTTAAMSSADYDIRNIVSLNYDKSNNRFFSSPTNVRVKLTIKRWDATSALISPTVTENLTITIDNRYNKKTIDKSYIKLSNGYKVTVYIDSIIVNNTPVNKLPDYVYVESEIHMNRYYEYTGSAAPALNDIIPINTDCDSANIDDELEIDWGTISGAEEYQLEWVFVNDYGVTPSTYKSTSALEADFKNNATRITTSFNYYKISLAFEHGYIAFRVRAVGRDYLNPDKYIYGNWSTGSGDIFTLSAISSSLYHNTVPHEKEKNWQYSATYAEEGKKKEVISYFDGSLHNRQSVTKVNSDNNTIVGETIYDYQGRTAVNVFPTPVVIPSSDTGSNIAPSLKYYENYNRNSVGTPYTKDNFDLDVSICTTTAEPMDTLSGSSQYYSGNNPNKLDFQAFVPDAEMYPFSQVEYTPDNTGRIRAQSGVGKPFQLGNGHETQYIYSQPNQIQLDRMFGSEAGDASHYKKNTVTDANGQVSISYLNQEGKTVATSLAGNPTLTDSTYMQALSSESGAVASLHVDAFNKDYNGNTLLNKITPLQDGIEFSTQLSVSYNSTYFFDYSLSIDTLADPCLNTDFCISCIYDLEIKVTNECGVNLTPGDSAITKKVGHLIPETNGFTMVCQSPTGTEVNDTFSVHLTPG
ncbi:MAG: hypothetical protein JNL69_09530, partial [Bacteroidia bacterium]|nr:hypothetical protein [Bacteroidia bacterium]